MNFDQLKLNLQGEVTLNYGKFISTVINFLNTYKGYNSAVEFSVALANHDMRKTWRSHGPRGHDTALNRIIQQ